MPDIVKREEILKLKNTYGHLELKFITKEKKISLVCVDNGIEEIVYKLLKVVEEIHTVYPVFTPALKEHFDNLWEEKK